MKRAKGSFGYVIAGILLIIMFAGKCGGNEANNEMKRLKNNIDALNDTVRYKNNKIGGITAEKKALAVTAKELKKQVYVKDERIAKLTEDFTELQSVTKAAQQVQIIKIPVPYRDSIPCVFERTIKVKEEWYSLNVFSNQKGISIDSLVIPNEQFLVVGQKRDGFFKPKYLTVQVTNTNPFLKTIDVQTQVVKIKQPFYNKGWFRVLEIAGGVFLGNKLVK